MHTAKKIEEQANAQGIVGARKRSRVTIYRNTRLKPEGATPQSPVFCEAKNAPKTKLKI